jgi:hypothetical protein
MAGLTPGHSISGSRISCSYCEDAVAAVAVSGKIALDMLARNVKASLSGDAECLEPDQE